MAKRLSIPPTKSSLLRLRRQIGFLEKGHDLLERKRELLNRLVHERLTTYLDLSDRVRTALEDAYHWLAISDLRMGSAILERASIGMKPAISIEIRPRSSLGIEYPSTKTSRLELQPISLMWTDASFDETRRRLADLAVSLARLGEAEMVLRRMLAEQRKTQKRVNALKNHIIPRYHETLRYISSLLEEEERDALYQIKLLSDRQIEHE